MRSVSLILISLIGFGLWSCNSTEKQAPNLPPVALVILGNTQDAGSPHIGCTKQCCINANEDDHYVVSLGVIDQIEERHWLFEATPDITEQLRTLHDLTGSSFIPDGIALTHAHIGHYTGLMYLGKEALGAEKVPVMCLPKMEAYLRNNGPWSQLVNDSNVVLHPLSANKDTALNQHISIQAFSVPHRDEYSETAGYLIKGPGKTALFIPDIDKWHLWERDIKSIITKVDYAFIDGTFFSKEELPHRNMEEIPHPLVEESMKLLQNLPEFEKNKVHFIHFNHTNPLLQPSSSARKQVLQNGFNIAHQGDIFNLQ